jgi:uncharacterized membrane protein
MDQNTPPQPSTDVPPASGGQPAGGMPPASNYPRPVGGGMVSQEEKTQALLMWILGLPLGFISPLIFFLISKDKPFVYRHAAQALAFHLVIFCAAIVASMLLIVLIGLFLFPVIGIFALVITIMGAMAANRGEDYDPPLTSGLAKALFKV